MSERWSTCLCDGALVCAMAAADESVDPLLGGTTTADEGGTDNELELRGVSELLVVVDVPG